MSVVSVFPVKSIHNYYISTLWVLQIQTSSESSILCSKTQSESPPSRHQQFDPHPFCKNSTGFPYHCVSDLKLLVCVTMISLALLRKNSTGFPYHSVSDLKLLVCVSMLSLALICKNSTGSPYHSVSNTKLLVCVTMISLALLPPRWPCG